MKPYKSPMQRITKANFVYQTFVNEYSDVKKEIEYEHKAFETVPIRTKDICNWKTIHKFSVKTFRSIFKKSE